MSDPTPPPPGPAACAQRSSPRLTPLSVRSTLRQLPRGLPSVPGAPGSSATHLPRPGACRERSPAGTPAPEGGQRHPRRRALWGPLRPASALPAARPRALTTRTSPESGSLEALVAPRAVLLILLTARDQECWTDSGSSWRRLPFPPRRTSLVLTTGAGPDVCDLCWQTSPLGLRK